MDLRRGVRGAACAACLCTAPMLASAEAPRFAWPNSYGAPGLIELPTAEVFPDGQLTGTVSAFQGSIRGTLSFQIAPRLTGSFRYSKIDNLQQNGSDLYDRSFDLSYLLLEERGWRPAVAIGLQDFIGTGVYSSEFIVATKHIRPNLAVTAGLGWGRLGSEGDIGSPFGERPPKDIGRGGKASVDQWFRGPVAPFAGVAWYPTDRLRLKLEYSSDGYVREVARGLFDNQSQWNIGADYQIRDGVILSGYYLHGSEVGLQMSVAVNPRKPVAPSTYADGPLPVQPRPDRAGGAPPLTGWVTEPSAQRRINDQMAEVLARDGIRLEAMALTDTTAELRIRNQRYRPMPQALGRTFRAMTRVLPASIETFTVTPVAEGVPTTAVTVRRSDVETLEHGPSAALLDRTRFQDGARPLHGRPLPPAPAAYPQFIWGLEPYAEVSLFDPDSPVRGDIGLRLSSRFEISPGIVLSGAVRKKVVGNLGDASRSSNSVLPKVRSDLVEYFREGDPAIEHLTAAWYARPAPDIYSRVTVGYLERMFGGVSGEVLWKPVGNRLALGAELNYVKQRDFDQMFGFRDYDIATGHVSAYYDIGNGFHGQIDVGRYLAGDWGTTLTLDREFANGWRVGAFATFTDVSADDFGEGSFDKGIRLTVPLDWLLGKPTRQANRSIIRPLTRDGGARLDVNGRLYDLLRDAGQDQIVDNWGWVWR